MLTVGSLFAGIGGLDLGLERAGMQVRWQVENNPYCIRVLEKHWPEVKRYGNIFEVDGTTLEPVDIICGGFPCQPVSQAGTRKGTSDDRWLWPEFVRIIRSVRPKYVLVENVPGLLSTDSGRLMGRVLGGLALCGYDAEWDCISAASVGALHRRDRIFIVAYSNSQRLARPSIPVFQRRSLKENANLSGAGQRDVPDSASSRTGLEEYRNCGQERKVADPPQPEVLRQEYGEVGSERIEPNRTDVSNPSDPRIAGGVGLSRDDAKNGRKGGNRRDGSRTNDGGQTLADTDCQGLSDFQGRETVQERGRDGTTNDSGWWDIEPDVGRVADGVPSRVDRLKAIGNSVVPQVGEVIGKMIMERENAI